MPQIAADYVISAYLNSPDGVYVNLFVPSQLTWDREGARYTLTQQTAYPTENLVNFHVETSGARAFTLYLRVPGWAGPHSAISVNGKRERTELKPGTFFPLRRTWNSGDRVEFEIDQRVRLEAVDKQTPNRFAVLRGPQVMFAVSAAPPEVTREQAASIQINPAGNDSWTYSHGGSTTPLRPFWRIQDETYQTYWKVIA